MLKHHVVPLPQTGFLRLSQIIGDPKATPSIPAIIPVSKSTWWNGVKEGRFPSSVKLGPRTTVWRVEDIRRLIESPGQAHSLLSAAHQQSQQQEDANGCL